MGYGSERNANICFNVYSRLSLYSVVSIISIYKVRFE